MGNKEKLMATIFFDTCAINYLVKQGLEGHHIKNQLTGHVPVIGRNTLYECAKTYKYPDLCKEIHLFIEDLDPWYTLTHEQLHKREAFALKDGVPFENWCNPEEKNLIKISNNLFISNNINQELLDSIERCEKNIEQAQRVWDPAKGNILTRKEKAPYKIQFEERVKKAAERDETPGELLLLFNNMNLQLSEKEIKKFLKHLDQYPALRTLFRTVLLLSDHSMLEKKPPRKDTFFDAIQFTEASYCTTFVSEDEKLVNDKEKSKNGKELYGRKLNPDIELLHIKNFMAHLNTKTAS